MTSFLSRAASLLLAVLLLGGGGARAAEITVMSSGGFYSSLLELAPAFERASGHQVVIVSGSSMGSSPTSIPARLQRGEPADVVILASTELDKLVAEKRVTAGSRVDLVHSRIGMVVRAGAPRPDIRTRESFERALLQAKSIGYSASASGSHLVAEVFPKLGPAGARQVMAKAREIVKDRVATWVARGDVEIGFQQVSELVTVPGVDFVGVIPAPYQKVTIFSAGVASGAKEAEAGRDLIRFLASPAAYPVIERQGLEPAARATDGRVEVLWLGQSCFRIATPSGRVIVTDPWLLKNPRTPAAHRKLEALGKVDVILVTHGHADHFADAPALALMNGVPLTAPGDLNQSVATLGILPAALAPRFNKGGTVAPAPGIRVTAVHAEHSSVLVWHNPATDKDEVHAGGEPVGYVIELENGFRIYHAGDTAVFGDMKLIGERYKPDLALVPIGGRFTMDPADAAYAVRELLKPKAVIPMHYGANPLAPGTAREFGEAMAGSEVRVLLPEPGEVERF